MMSDGIGRSCSCQFVPCICVLEADSASHVDVPVMDPSSGSHAPARKKSKLRSLVEADAMTQCTACMFLPCICPGEDERTSSPLNSESCGTSDGQQDEWDDAALMDAYGRVPLLLESKDGSEARVAREIRRHLKPHQVKGVAFLHSHLRQDQGCILADYMGLGKTLQVITVVHSFLVDQLEERERKLRIAKGEEDEDDEDDEEQEEEEEEEEDTAMPAISKGKHGAIRKRAPSDAGSDRPATAMVLCPAICIPNWEAEFKKWLSTESQAQCPVFTLDSGNGKSSVAGRQRLLQKWSTTGGVLLLGYEMYRSLLNPTTTAAVNRDASIQVCTRVANSTMQVTSAVASRAAKAARDFHRLLCDPGPDLVILDEGHRMKDPTSLLCQSVAKIRSLRRLVLTGYPLQNSLSEYWCMVNFARPGFLGAYETFRARYERPIMEGDTQKSKQLIIALKDVVLRRGKSLLRTQLPPKKEWILYCKLSPLQHRLYCDFLSYYSASSDGKATADLLTAYAALLQVMNHPDIIYHKLTPQTEVDDEAVEEPQGRNGYASDGGVEGWSWESEERLVEKRQQAEEQIRKRRQRMLEVQRAYEWARPRLIGSVDGSPRSYSLSQLENSGKMAVLLQLVKESLACGDKVVVFSQSVPTLKVIGQFLDASSFSPNYGLEPRSTASTSQSMTTEGRKRKRASLLRSQRDPAGILRKRMASNAGNKSKKPSLVRTVHSSREWFLQIDGNTSGAKRIEYIERFSSTDNRVKLLLVSTRAGAEGINLHAANRLILFDVSWNPSNDHQSMCRSHRIGQMKTVHVYRLVSTGTMERMIYEQQMKKVDLSTNVVDHHDGQPIRTESEDTESRPSAAPIGETGGPFCGFLRPPNDSDFDKSLDPDTKRDAALQDDAVLQACIEKAGQWLVDARPVHEPYE